MIPIDKPARHTILRLSHVEGRRIKAKERSECDSNNQDETTLPLTLLAAHIRGFWQCVCLRRPSQEVQHLDR
jgi:hypothetical protein